MPKESDFDADSVFQQARDGDLGALGQVLNDMKSDFMHWVSAKKGAPYEHDPSPDDLFQDFIVMALNDAASFHGHTSAACRSWLFHMAIHRKQKEARKRRAVKRGLGKTVSQEHGESAKDVIDSRQFGGDVLAELNEAEEKLSEWKKLLSRVKRGQVMLCRKPSAACVKPIGATG